MENHIKNTSIQGRFALGLTCLRKKIRAEDIQWKKEMQTVLAKFSTFTSSDQLDIWETEIQFYGTGILSFENSQRVITAIGKENAKMNELSKMRGAHGAYYKDQSFTIEDPQIYTDLLAFYKTDTSGIKEVVDLCEAIGRGSLYGAVVNHSPETVKPVLEIIDRLGMHDAFDFKTIADTYPFKLEDGWGHSFNFNTFLK